MRDGRLEAAQIRGRADRDAGIAREQPLELRRPVGVVDEEPERVRALGGQTADEPSMTVPDAADAVEWQLVRDLDDVERAALGIGDHQVTSPRTASVRHSIGNASGCSPRAVAALPREEHAAAHWPKVGIAVLDVEVVHAITR